MPTEPLPRLNAAWLLLPVLAALAAYHAVPGFGFVFDDQNAIVGNRALQAGDWWGAAFGRYNSLSNRPLACLSLAIDLRLGLGPGGMHVTSLLLHLVNATLVLLVVREVRRGDALTAALVATLWAVHPLGVDAVAYLTQRSMLLMACFALVALLALLRAHRSARPWRWRLACVLATAAALASKEEAAALPILLVLADRAFGLPRWSAMRARLPFYAGLAASWLVLLACVGLGPRNPTVGYATVPPATAFEWLLTQTRCLTHYVTSVVWPADLRGMYDFAVLREPGPAVLPGLALLAALGATLLAFRRHPRLGFAGACCFLLLAPTSSVYPIITEPCADRRMYLPLLAVLVPLVLALRTRLPARGFVALAVALALPLGWRTAHVAAAYRDQTTFAQHAYASNALANRSFLAGRILAAMARVAHERGDDAAADDLVVRAMQCEAPGRAERLVEANMFAGHGRSDDAERALRAILRDYPDYADAMGNLAGLLHARSEGRPAAQAQALLAEAEQLCRRGLVLAEHSPELHNTLAVVLSTEGRGREAVPELERALALAPGFVEARLNLAVAWLQQDDPRRALAALDPLQATHRDDPRLQQLIGLARAMLGGR